jgi:hypothetical protein
MTMKAVFLALVLSIFAFAPAAAQGPSCASQAMSKDGKALAGAARTSAIRKCCATRAVSSEGKKLSGAAKTSFMKKCEAET